MDLAHGCVPMKCRGTSSPLGLERNASVENNSLQIDFCVLLPYLIVIRWVLHQVLLTEA